jgi:hypothetical protein
MNDLLLHGTVFNKIVFFGSVAFQKFLFQGLFSSDLFLRILFCCGLLQRSIFNSSFLFVYLVSI